jgi:hypothetical protein
MCALECLPSGLMKKILADESTRQVVVSTKLVKRKVFESSGATS